MLKKIEKFAVKIVAASAALYSANIISATQPFNPYSKLDAVAATVSPNKLTPLQVTVMADAVFAIPHHGLIQQIPAEVSSFVREKFAAYEEAYWKGQHTGIREQDIVTALNGVVAQLNLPEYAKTSQSQIRYLRMWTLQENPRFMGLKMAKGSPTGEPTAISDTMSPLQAYHLTLTLVDQKFVEPFYQVTPAEWENRSPPEPAARSRPHIGTSWDNPRDFEMQSRVREALSSLSDAQGLAMLLKTLNAVGIR